MDRPKVWWRVALGLALTALLGVAIPVAHLAQAATVDSSNQIGQVNALFLAGFYRHSDDETAELTIINPNSRKDGDSVDALVVLYGDGASILGCGLFTLKPNESTDPIDLDQVVQDSGGSGLDAFGSVLVIITQSDDDFIGTVSTSTKKKKSKNNGASAERGAVAYVSQTDGSFTLSQVRLWPFDLDSTEVSKLRTDVGDSSNCDGSNSAAKLNHDTPARVQSNVDGNHRKSSKSKSSKKPGKTSLVLTNGGYDGE